MSAKCLLSRLLLAGAATLSAVSGAMAAAPTAPAGFDIGKQAAINKPGRLFKWKTVIARAEVPVFKSFEGDERLADPPPTLGEVCYVAHDYNKPGTPRRFLIGRFDNDGDKFVSWVGWIDECNLLDEPRPLQVKAARDYLAATLPRDHPHAKKINSLLPDASREDFQSVTLKAVTHPERGKACFPKPVAPEDYDAALKSGNPLALQPFAFFYVFKVAVEPKGVFCLLGPRSSIELDGRTGDKFREQVSGWVDINSLILWTTREAFEYRLEPAALDTRRSSKRPIELYASDRDLRDWAQWELGGRRGDSPAKPIFSEELDSAKAPATMTKPWLPHWMRYPIISSYNLQGQTATPPAGVSGKWLGYQLCMLGSTEGGGGGTGAPDIEENKKRLNDAVAQMNVFELVLIIDTTGSMEILFEPLKKAVVELVKELKNKAAVERDNLEKIQLRVAVVLYKDHESKGEYYLTKDSNDFFDVMGTPGMEAFERWIETEVKSQGGGGNPLEEPFEGIKTAVSKFLSVDGAGKHTKGAARVCMVLGDGGNNDSGTSPLSKLTLDDVSKMLDVVGTENVGGQARNLAKIQVHSVLTLHDEGYRSSPQAKQWEQHMPELARLTGANSQAFVLNDGTRGEAVKKLTDVLNTAMEVRREIMHKELEAIRAGVSSAGGGATGGGGAAAGAATVIGKDRLAEILGKDEVDKLSAGLSKAFFSVVNAAEQVPGESEQLSRLKLCILLTEQEFLRIQTVCQLMGTGLEDELTRNTLTGSGETVRNKIKELVIKAMLTAFGENPTPAKMSELMKKSLPEVQRETSGLPVQFGCLKKLPEDEAQLKKMTSDLKFKAGGLLQVISGKRDRFFPAGVATGENHIWVYKDELP